MDGNPILAVAIIIRNILFSQKERAAKFLSARRAVGAKDIDLLIIRTQEDEATLALARNEHAGELGNQRNLFVSRCWSYSRRAVGTAHLFHYVPSAAIWWRGNWVNSGHHLSIPAFDDSEYNRLLSSCSNPVSPLVFIRLQIGITGGREHASNRSELRIWKGRVQMGRISQSQYGGRATWNLDCKATGLPSRGCGIPARASLR